MGPEVAVGTGLVGDSKGSPILQWTQLRLYRGLQSVQIWKIMVLFGGAVTHGAAQGCVVPLGHLLAEQSA